MTSLNNFCPINTCIDLGIAEPLVWDVNTGATYEQINIDWSLSEIYQNVNSPIVPLANTFAVQAASTIAIAVQYNDIYYSTFGYKSTGSVSNLTLDS